MSEACHNNKFIANKKKVDLNKVAFILGKKTISPLTWTQC